MESTNSIIWLIYLFSLANAFMFGINLSRIKTVTIATKSGTITDPKTTHNFVITFLASLLCVISVVGYTGYLVTTVTTKPEYFAQHTYFYWVLACAGVGHWYCTIRIDKIEKSIAEGIGKNVQRHVIGKPKKINIS